MQEISNDEIGPEGITGKELVSLVTIRGFPKGGEWAGRASEHMTKKDVPTGEELARTMNKLQTYLDSS